MSIQELWLEVNGLRIHTLRAGEKGLPIVLFHGGGLDSAALSWELLMPVLAENHRVFAADFPGYGESDKPQADYSMEYYLQFVPSLLNTLEIEQADLVGISMGGAIALGTALRTPQYVKRLILVDSYGLQDKAPMHFLSWLFVKMRWLNKLTWKMYEGNRSLMRSALKALLRNPQAITESLVDLALSEVKNSGSSHAWITFQESELLLNGTRTCYMNHLSEIDKPTLIIHGRQDQAVPLRFAQMAHQGIANSRLEILENCGHWPQRDQTGLFNKIVSEFLKDSDL